MLQNKWYLLCPAEELKKNRIIAKTIVGEHIIAFRTSSGDITAIEDRCCHRNVPLSMGFLKNDRIVCAYHGWQFDRDGQCVLIPSQGSDEKIPQTARIKRFPVVEKNRLLWVFIGDAALATTISPFEIPEMDTWPFTYGEHVFEADLESAAESLLDPYHIAFAHRNSIKSFMGQIEDYNPDFDIQVHEDGIEGRYLRKNVGNLGEKMYFGNDEFITTKYRFYYPNISRLEVVFKERTLLIIEHIMLVEGKRISMTQITLWKNIFKGLSFFAKRMMKKQSDQIVNEDIDLLRAQQLIYEKAGDDLREVSVKGDRVSLAFRKFWRQQMRQNTNQDTN